MPTAIPNSFKEINLLILRTIVKKTYLCITNSGFYGALAVLANFVTYIFNSVCMACPHIK